MLYAASPLRDSGGAVTGALRLSLPLPDLMEALGSAKTIFIFVAAAAALIALAASGAFVGTIARPVEALSERARRYAEGKRLPGAAMPDGNIAEEEAGAAGDVAVETDEHTEIGDGLDRAADLSVDRGLDGTVR